MDSMRSLLSALALLLTSLVLSRRINSFAGPWTMIVGRNTECVETWPDFPAEMKFRTSHFNPMKRKENQTATGHMYLPKGIDDTYSATVRVDHWANNVWKENYFVMAFPGGACTEMMTNMPSAMKTLFKDGVTRNPCSIQPHNYTLKNEPVDFRMPNFPVLPYGEFRAVVSISQRGNMYLGTCTEFSVIPKM